MIRNDFLSRKAVIFLFVTVPIVAMGIFAALYYTYNDGGVLRTAKTIATVTSSTGDAILARKGKTIPLEKGVAVKTGDMITVGEQGVSWFTTSYGVQFALGSGSFVRFEDFNTEEVAGNLQLILERGSVKAEASSPGSMHELEIVSPTLISTLRMHTDSALVVTYGTEQQKTTLYVLRGKAFLRGPGFARSSVSGLSLEKGYMVSIGLEGDAQGIQKILDTSVPLSDIEL